MDRFGCALVDVQRLRHACLFLGRYFDCISKLLVNFKSTNEALVALVGRHIFEIFEVWVLLNQLIFLIAALDEVEGIGAKHAIELLVDDGIDLFFEVLLEQFGEEIDHSFEEVLIFEDEFGLAIA